LDIIIRRRMQDGFAEHLVRPFLDLSTPRRPRGARTQPRGRGMPNSLGTNSAVSQSRREWQRDFKGGTGTAFFIAYQTMTSLTCPQGGTWRSFDIIQRSGGLREMGPIALTGSAEFGISLPAPKTLYRSWRLPSRSIRLPRFQGREPQLDQNQQCISTVSPALSNEIMSSRLNRCL
jgi:hypothetical protein